MTFKNLDIMAFAASLALVLAGPAAAITVVSAPGAPDPGIAGTGLRMVADFDNPTAAGIVQTNVGTVIRAAGSQGGVRAAPAGTAANGVYLSVGANSSSTFDFTNYFGPGRKLGRLSLYWGSVDSYNFVDFLSPANAVVQTISGSQLPAATGDQILGLTNRRVTFLFAPLENISKVRFRSTSPAFELDSIAAAVAPIPEPASWAMLIVGFALIGVTLRRRGRLANVAA